ncbi:MAG: hypothetical protein J0L60_06620 [Ignavibacteria bacterium]|nr:hypothetical protein [Ignavibacteria bacterium]
MNLQQTISTEANRLMKMASMLTRIAGLKIRISELEPLLYTAIEEGNEEDHMDYQREIVEYEIELELLIEGYNEMLETHKRTSTNLKPLVV